MMSNIGNGLNFFKMRRHEVVIALCCASKLGRALTGIQMQSTRCNTIFVLLAAATKKNDQDTMPHDADQTISMHVTLIQT
jgi:hypothetical protein